MRAVLSLFFILVLPTAPASSAFAPKVRNFPRRITNVAATTYEPVFDFNKVETLEIIDRLDDAVMGGISSSSVHNGNGFAKWRGVCRTNGGGFCGFRTNAFEEPLQVQDSDGFYLSCRLTSDKEPHRRMWKITTRTKPDRGESLYQAPFELTNENSFSVVKVPFNSFKYVRGPRIVVDGPPLNVTGGLYQVGLTMSKFQFSENMTEVENFRSGFFELQLKEIGLYKEGAFDEVAVPKVLTKEESKKRRPIIAKMALLIATVFFSEQSQRRKTAMKILREKRKLLRSGAVLWGFRSRSKGVGKLRSAVTTASILAIDFLRAVATVVLRIAVFLPVRLIFEVKRVIKRDPEPFNE